MCMSNKITQILSSFPSLTCLWEKGEIRGEKAKVETKKKG
jgi:hypothetical protein